MKAHIEAFSATIRQAQIHRQPLTMCGGGSKLQLAASRSSDPACVLNTRHLSGILDYDPTELVLTAWAGTPLQEIEQALAEQGQMLACEAPYAEQGATLGGALAAGLSGPRRPYVGALRDFVLGLSLIDGRGQQLAFGGQVMKNVAGFDVSRFMVGGWGSFGLILSVSLKVLPQPRSECSIALELDAQSALAAMNRWAGQALPLSASAWHDGVLSVRLSGSERAVHSARSILGGSVRTDAEAFWDALKNQTHPFFQMPGTLWRLALPSTSPPVPIWATSTLIEWGGAQRWCVLNDDGQQAHARVQREVREAGGHASVYRSSDIEIRKHWMGVLPEAQRALLLRLKQQFDPAGIFNPGILFPEC